MAVRWSVFFIIILIGLVKYIFLLTNVALMYPGGNHSYNNITAVLKSQLNMSVGVKVKGAIEML